MKPSQASVRLPQSQVRPGTRIGPTGRTRIDRRAPGAAPNRDRTGQRAQERVRGVPSQGNHATRSDPHRGIDVPEMGHAHDRGHRARDL